ncbi:MAG TPA: hypothetical protein VGB38_04165 [bacterium]
MNRHPPEKDWLRLDNAAKIYPPTTTEQSPSVFRLSVTMARPVKPWALTNALESVMRRCPYFQVFLRRGFFWYYLQRHNEIPRVQLLDPVDIPIFPVADKTAHLLRVSARESTIAVDYSHILTDGNGGVRFLITLVAEYLRACGIEPGQKQGILDPKEKPSVEEYEDAFKKVFQRGMPRPENLPPAYHVPGKPSPHQRFRRITGRMPVDKALDRSRLNGVSLTEYLTALYMVCLSEIYQDEVNDGKKPKRSIIRIEVPVNMRQFCPSKTMRNFSLYAAPEIDMKLGVYGFDEIVARVHHGMQMQITRKELGRQISRNVGAELNPTIRVLPLFIKDRFLSWLYARLGENLYTGVLSNLGRMDVPEEMAPHVKSFHLVLNPNHVMKKSCTVISYQNDLAVTFCSVVESRRLERRFFTKLAGNGIPVTVAEV